MVLLLTAEIHYKIINGEDILMIILVNIIDLDNKLFWRQRRRFDRLQSLSGIKSGHSNNSNSYQKRFSQWFATFGSNSMITLYGQ